MTSASVDDIGDPAAVRMVLASAILDVIDPQQHQHQQPSLSTAPSSKPTTRAYYRDSSGRARVHLRVRLSTPDDDGGLNALLTCGCISPTPLESPSVSANGKMMPDGQNGNESEQLLADDAEQNKSTKLRPPSDLILSFECTTTPPSSSKTPLPSLSSLPCCWTVEGVTILRCEIERTVDSTSSSTSISALLFDIEIAICGNGVSTIQRKNDLYVNEEIDEMLEVGILTIIAALRRRRQPPGKNAMVQQQQDTSSSMTAQSLLQGNNVGGIVASLLGIAHDSGMSINNITPFSATNNNTMGTEITHTPPIHVHTTLIPSLQVSVREVCGARAPSGSTLVEITVEHASRWHQENVIVTGISFHPGQSRLLHWHTNNGSSFGGAAAENNESTVATNPPPNQLIGTHGGKSMQGGELSVIDMSRRVRWGFVPGSAPDLPMTLEPYDAIATVIQIDAGEDVRSRAFLSPISVNATIPRSDSSSGERIMITTDARWTSSRVGIENSDAFRVDLSLRGGDAATTTVCRVGAPLVISIRILNLSMEPRDLMLLMAKDDEKRNRDLLWEQQRPVVDDGSSSSSRRRKVRQDAGNGGDYYSQQGNIPSQPSSKASNIFNTAVVSEVNGYTFGVWGLSSEDDGTTRHHRDHELLAVDAALLLGEVKGQHSIQAELRFVPLREGTLDVPNLKLFDKRELKWYNCSHTLKIVATQST
jgi:hypothetical protein